MLLEGGRKIERPKIVDKLHEAWSLLSSYWRGEGADIFAQQYMPKFIEYAEKYDIAFRDLSEVLDSLEDELKELEIEMRRE